MTGGEAVEACNSNRPECGISLTFDPPPVASQPCEYASVRPAVNRSLTSTHNRSPDTHSRMGLGEMHGTHGTQISRLCQDALVDVDADHIRNLKLINVSYSALPDLTLDSLNTLSVRSVQYR